MIFVTVGSMFSFDRLIRAMDDWAARHPDTKVIAQIGDGLYEPVNMSFERMVPPSTFRQLNDDAEIIVAHAGMGSVFTASEIGKPIVLLPRSAELKEHTTDHQIHTAGWLREKTGIFVADTNAELDAQIDAARNAAGGQKWSKFAPVEFTDKIRSALAG